MSITRGAFSIEEREKMKEEIKKLKEENRKLRSLLENPQQEEKKESNYLEDMLC